MSESKSGASVVGVVGSLGATGPVATGVDGERVVNPMGGATRGAVGAGAVGAGTGASGAAEMTTGWPVEKSSTESGGWSGGTEGRRGEGQRVGCGER